MSELEKEIADSKITALQQEVSNAQKKYDTVVMAVNITFGILFIIFLGMALLHKNQKIEANPKVVVLIFVVSFFILIIGNAFGTSSAKISLDNKKHELSMEIK